MLKNNQEFYKICFENAREGIIVVDENGIILLINSRVEKIFGYHQDELLNQSVNILLPKSIHQKHNNNMINYHHNSIYQNGFDRKDLYGIHKNGDKIAVLIGLSFFELENKKYVKAFINDVSNYKEKEQLFRKLNYNLEVELKLKNKELRSKNKQLKETNIILSEEIKSKIEAEKKAIKTLVRERELNNLKSKFLTLASHEFRTPLSGILTSITLIEKYNDLKNLAKVETHVGKVKSLVNHLNNILQDFLTLEQINSGEILYNYKSLNAFEIINTIINDTKSLLKKNQKIKYIVNNSNTEIINDKRIIINIITNLLYNSIKYSPEKSLIEIESKIKDDKLVFSIKDNGIGIPKSDQKHIFERFFRARNALDIQGTGIGLNIIKGHVDGLKGSIKFESTENIGTKFIVKIPNFKI